MLLPAAVAAYAGEVALKREAAASLALGCGRRAMLLMCVLAFARGTPLVHVEPLAPGQPVHAYLLGAPWHETETLAWALPALGFRGLLGECAVMFWKHVAAEAARV